MSIRAITSVAAVPSTSAQRLVASIVPILLGAFIFYGVALSPIAAIHNAAHDTRHAIVAPCH